MSGAPLGGGWLPSRCMRSGRFTPAAATRTRISFAPGVGTARVSATSAARPPGFGAVIASIVFGRLLMPAGLAPVGRPDNRAGVG